MYIGLLFTITGDVSIFYDSSVLRKTVLLNMLLTAYSEVQIWSICKLTFATNYNRRRLRKSFLATTVCALSMQ